MKQLHKTWLLLSALFPFIWVGSQQQKETTQSLRDQYQSAKAIYDSATAVGNSKNYVAAKEEALNQKALLAFKDLLRHLPEGDQQLDSLRFRTFFVVGELHHYFEHEPEALLFYTKAIAVHPHTSLPDSLLFRPYLYAGIICYNQNKIDSAAQLFYKAEAIQAKYTKLLDEGERLYNTLGVIAFETGNYRQAKNYFGKALEVLQPGHPYYSDLLVNYKINLAQMHFRLDEFEEANKLYNELLPLNKNRNEIYHNIGLVNLKLGATEKALTYFRKVTFPPYKQLNLYSNTASAFLSLKQYDSARKYLEKALALWQKDSVNHIGYGLVLKGMGDLAMNEGRPSVALQYYTKAIAQFYPAYGRIDVHESPQKFSGVFSYINLYEALIAKAEAALALYNQGKEVAWANTSLKTYQAAFQLMDYVSRTYNNDESRLFINRYKYSVHAKPIDLAFSLYQKTGNKKYVEDLYILDQQNKASVLVLNQQETTRGKDTTLVQREKALRSAITRLSLQAARMDDSTKLSEINRQIGDYELQLENVQDSMPAERASVERIPSIAFLQHDVLDGNTILLSYHLSEEKLTTLSITEKSLDCFQQPLPASFHEDVNAYVQNLKNPGSAVNEDAKKICQLLFGNINMDSKKRLIIIPDDELNYLSFESLLLSDDHYLAEKFTIQYQYSSALLKATQDKIGNGPAIAFAPFVSGSSAVSPDFSALSYSENEVATIEGKKVTGAAATKPAFLKQVANYKVVHLATHAVAGNGPGKSYIVFHTDSSKESPFLFTEEIYQLPLSGTELVILSACETAGGNLVKGEGVMSLSRAFTYAGCPNIITSLWKADDYSTAYLTGKIHHYLNRSYTIDKAVQQAKLDYLADVAIHPRMKHPYYWAHLIFVGEHQKESSHLLAIYILIAVIFFAAFVFFLRRKRLKA